MYILIMGDSWGFSLDRDILEGRPYSIENMLFLDGHIVFNKSHFGGSNTGTLEFSSAFLKATKNLFEIDLIIWFVTELGRDFGHVDFSKIRSYTDFLDQIHQITLEKSLKVKKLAPKAKWIIIGGHTSLYNEEDYDWADCLIPDWKSVLTGIAFPKCQCMNTHDFLFKYKNLFGLDAVDQEAKNYLDIIKIQQDNPDIFFDGVHVTVECYKRLYDQNIKPFLSK